MANVFDQFDQPAQSANVFDQFDAPKPSSLKGGLEFSPFGIDTGLTMPESVSNVVAGVGKGMTDLVQGAGQHLGLVDQADLKLRQQSDTELSNTTGGKVGAVAGNVALALPTAFIPGANTITGAALTGAGLGAIQPVAEGDVLKETAKNAIVGAATGAAGQVAGKAIGYAASKVGVAQAAKQAAIQAANAERDATLKAAQEAGYVVTPAMTEGNVTGKILNGLSGKAKTEQLARVKNQAVTDSLARKALGLPNDVPITSDVTQAVRKAAFDTGYKPVSQVGNVATDSQYSTTLDNIAKKYSGASSSFPDAVENKVVDIVNNYKVKSFDASHAVDQIQYLRNLAGDAFKKGESNTANAYKSVSKALEDQLERHLSSMGSDGAALLKGFRDARVLMAKSHTVEDAVREGSGSVDAAKLAAALQKGKPLSGDLKTAAKFANNYKEVARMPGGADANPLTVLDFVTGGAGYSVNPYLAALPLGRVAARYSVLSNLGQKAFTTPNYSQAILPKAIQSIAESPLSRILPPSIYAGQ